MINLQVSLRPPFPYYSILNQARSKTNLKDFWAINVNNYLKPAFDKEMVDYYIDASSSIVYPEAYTNIDLMIDSALKDYGYYDLIWMSGLADYILEFCRDDYNHLKEMVYQMLNFSNLKELFSALNGVDTEALDRLTKEVNETRTNIDPSIIANLAKVVDFVDPMTATVKNSIQENVA